MENRQLMPLDGHELPTADGAFFFTGQWGPSFLSQLNFSTRRISIRHMRLRKRAPQIDNWE
jgi:hypothetical protein